MGMVETALVAPTLARPAEMVSRQDIGRAALLRLEREETIPGTDVEHALARKRRNEDLVGFFLQRGQRLDASARLPSGNAKL